MATIEIHDKMEEWEHFDDSVCVHIFLYLLIKAKKNQTTWKGHRIKRGQLVCSRGQISAATGISPDVVKYRMPKMKGNELEWEIIEHEGRKYTLITILNYSKHQKRDSGEKTPAQKQADTKAKNKTIVKQFRKPTLEEVETYIKERVAKGRPEVDAEQFWNFYQSKGWRVGNQPMKEWHCAVVTWEKREIDKGNVGSRPVAKSANKATPKQMMTDWIDANPNFKQWHGMSLRDFCDVIAVDLADIDDYKFKVKYGVSKSYARQIKEPY